MSKKSLWVVSINNMRRAIGFVIILWALSEFFTGAFAALDDAARESFETIEAAAITSQLQLIEVGQ